MVLAWSNDPQPQGFTSPWWSLRGGTILDMTLFHDQKCHQHNEPTGSRHQGTMASRCPPQSFWITSISSKSCQGVAVNPAAWDRMRQPPRQLTSVSDRSEASRGSLSISAMRHSCWDSIPGKKEARTASCQVLDFQWKSVRRLDTSGKGPSFAENNVHKKHHPWECRIIPTQPPWKCNGLSSCSYPTPKEIEEHFQGW